MEKRGVVNTEAEKTAQVKVKKDAKKTPPKSAKEVSSGSKSNS